MSREIDAEVASKVMGVPFNAMTQRGFTGSIYAETPHYSTDIAAAWMVVEKMIERGFSYELGDAKEGHYATFWNGTKPAEYGPSLPECICKAALEAMKHG